MSLRSVYLPAASIENDRIRIGGDEHQHLVVARAEKDELLQVFDGKGSIWTVAVESFGKRETVAVVKDFEHAPPDPLQLILGLAMIRIPAFEWALEKVVEVGVTRIVPCVSDRSNVAPAKRHERWMRILIEAAKQSKRYYIPRLDEAMPFNEVVSIPATSKIMFAERCGGGLKPALSGPPVLYLVGPEGGWTDSELSAASSKGFHPVSLGAGILKAETAAIVGGALIRYELSPGNAETNRLE